MCYKKSEMGVIGYTTGVFDLFHVGHLNILKQAKRNCDFLIVGVSTDKLVLEYKKKKTIIPYEERIEIVKAIKYVDQVVPQRTLDKYEAWERLHFNILFHGNDWQNTDLYNDMQKKLGQEGVEVRYFEYTKGTSSSEIKELIYKNLS